jgi:hypothetical protein
VQRVDSSAGRIKVGGAGRSNATPNLDTGKIFAGNASNQAVTTNVAYIDIANSRVGIGTTSPTEALTVKSNQSFVSPDGTDEITISMLDSDTLSISGDAGQLFSITDTLSGTIFSVNDISGIPSIEVDDDGTVRLAEYSGNVLIGTATDDGSNKLQVNGSIVGTSVNTTHASDNSELTTLTSTSATQIASLTAADFRSAKVYIQATDTVSSEYHVTELLLVHDGTNVTYTEYGMLYTGSAVLATFTADINSGNVRILAAGASTNSTTYKVVKTMIEA